MLAAVCSSRKTKLNKLKYSLINIKKLIVYLLLLALRVWRILAPQSQGKICRASNRGQGEEKHQSSADGGRWGWEATREWKRKQRERRTETQGTKGAETKLENSDYMSALLYWYPKSHTNPSDCEAKEKWSIHLVGLLSLLTKRTLTNAHTEAHTLCVFLAGTVVGLANVGS